MAVTDNSGRNFLSELCPCWDMVLLASGPPPPPDLKAHLREKIAYEALHLGMAGKQVGRGETRGRGGRRRKLETAITIASVVWDRRTSVDADIENCAAWVDHLRAERLTSHDALRTHLRELRQLNVSDLEKLEHAQDAIPVVDLSRADDIYGNKREKWGLCVLADLLGVEVESIKRMRRRPRTVLFVSTDLNALAELEGRDPQEEFHQWRQQRHKKAR